MRKFAKSPLMLLLGGGVVVFILLSLNRTSPSVKKLKTDTYTAKMNLALLYMQQGQSPMAGIGLFRKIVKDYPDRFEAPFQLGSFAMTTGQYEKASNWFKLAANRSKGENKVLSLINWSDALVMIEKKDSARLILKEVFDYSNDSLLLRSVNERLQVLK